jgi:hypothetical protein
MDLGAGSGCGRMSHKRPPCGWWCGRHPHHPTSEVSFHPCGGCLRGGRDRQPLRNSWRPSVTVVLTQHYAFRTCHSCQEPLL